MAFGVVVSSFIVMYTRCVLKGVKAGDSHLSSLLAFVRGEEMKPASAWLNIAARNTDDEEKMSTTYTLVICLTRHPPSADDIKKLDSFINKSKKSDYCNSKSPPVKQLFAEADTSLFKSVLTNRNHLLSIHLYLLLKLNTTNFEHVRTT